MLFFTWKRQTNKNKISSALKLPKLTQFFYVCDLETFFFKKKTSSHIELYNFFFIYNRRISLSISSSLFFIAWNPYLIRSNNCRVITCTTTQNKNKKQPWTSLKKIMISAIFCPFAIITTTTITYSEYISPPPPLFHFCSQKTNTTLILLSKNSLKKINKKQNAQ